MPLTKDRKRSSGTGFHPFNGRVSRHLGASVRKRPHPHARPYARVNNRPRKRHEDHRKRGGWNRNKFSHSQLSPEDAYLSYHDVRLTREDIDSIKHDDWLTDNVICFWEEFLEREKLASFPKAHVVLLRPSMAFMLQNTKDPLTLKSALPDFQNTTHVFLPVNDCRDVTRAEGGSHWSLLLVSIVDGVAFHYDSLSSANIFDAKLVSHKISQLLGKPLRFINLEDCPQQENSVDCGVYVCLLMQHLLMSKLLLAQSQEKISMSMRGKAVDASGGRKEIMRIIDERRKEGERRRSRSHSPYTSSKSKSPPRVGVENAGSQKP
jgi:sentrin-specific protease 8